MLWNNAAGLENSNPAFPGDHSGVHAFQQSGDETGTLQTVEYKTHSRTAVIFSNSVYYYL